MKIADGIDSLEGYTSINPIFEGYSSDHKYLVEKNSKKYLLRTFRAEESARKSEEFAALKLMAERKVKCSYPIEIGVLKHAKLGYMLLSFIDGTGAEASIPQLNPRAQYDLGVEAGLELRKINECEAPIRFPEWHERKLAKHTRYLKEYWDGDVRFRNDEKVEKFISDNIHLMKGRPNRFQHDDFHIKNLIVHEGMLAGVIDFNRFDWGDPYHEFLKVGLFSSEVSVPFSVGQIHGYFDGKDPDDGFWTLYSLYLAMSLFSSITWTKHVCPDEMTDMIKILERALEDHTDFKEIRPIWYANYERT